MSKEFSVGEAVAEAILRYKGGNFIKFSDAREELETFAKAVQEGDVSYYDYPHEDEDYEN